MSVEGMRDRVIGAYKGDNWKKKVNNMSDSQVIAVYYSLLRSGKIK